ncbi:hypothetical protein CPLU01_09856 [Colletotrichum plurivorum]|uniref:Uncharacterized protein n=1 Tax=Colletotrichum plurivorum TaxID=2175906 RepID=A0A8H6K737_9PEZI|nr:hypothetical protein CPLU01_09856 [Colletotrichum plurivorum]
MSEANTMPESVSVDEAVNDWLEGEHSNNGIVDPHHLPFPANIQSSPTPPSPTNLELQALPRSPAEQRLAYPISREDSGDPFEESGDDEFQDVYIPAIAQLTHRSDETIRSLPPIPPHLHQSFEPETHPASQSLNQPASQSASQPATQSAILSGNQPAAQSAAQPENPPAAQSAILPAIRPATHYEDQPATQRALPTDTATMAPSRLDVERFNNKDPDTGRPRKQEEWIQFATHVMGKDPNYQIWHPQLRAKIMTILHMPVTVRSLQPAQHITYHQTKMFSRGQKQPYQEVDLWASLFRGLNNMPKAWSDGVNSGDVWAFSDVIQACYEDEPRATTLENYQKTRGLQHIEYFTPAPTLGPSPLGPSVRSGNVAASVVNSAAIMSATVSQASPRDDTSQTTKRKREAVILSDDESEIEILSENPVLKKTKLGASDAKSVTGKLTIKIDESSEGDDMAGDKGVSDKKAFTKGKCAANETSMAGEAAKEPADSWMMEAIKDTKKAESPREKVKQRNEFFTKLEGIPRQHRDMIFRTAVLDMIQDLGVDPTQSLSRQIKAYNACSIKDDVASEK